MLALTPTDSREDASLKCLTLLLSQSNEERRALRSDYAGVRAMIHNGMCKPRFSNLYDDSPGAAIVFCDRRVFVCDFLCAFVCDCRGEG